MRILHVVPSYIPAYRYGGPIYSVHGLCRALVARGHDVHVFTTNVDGDRDSDVPLETAVDIDGVKVWYFRSAILRRLYWSPGMGRKLMEQSVSFDLLHLHSIYLWPTWFAARVSWRHGIPYVLSPRGMLVKELIHKKNRYIKTAWINLIERRIIEKAAVIHATSRVEYEDILRFGFRLEQAEVVPNGMDAYSDGQSEVSVPEHIRELTAKGPYLLFLGRINWKKGLDRLIPALLQIPNVRLLIVGNDDDGYRPYLEKLSSSAGLLGRVHFCGPAYSTDKEYLYRNAMAFVLPSYSENFGISALEAMSAGCPVVVTPEVGISDIVRERGSGIVSEGYPEMLGNNIRGLLSNREAMRLMGERGKAAVKELFAWEGIALKMEKVYNSVLNGQVKGR